MASTKRWSRWTRVPGRVPCSHSSHMATVNGTGLTHVRWPNAHLISMASVVADASTTLARAQLNFRCTSPLSFCSPGTLEGGAAKRQLDPSQDPLDPGSRIGDTEYVLLMLARKGGSMRAQGTITLAGSAVASTIAMDPSFGAANMQGTRPLWGVQLMDWRQRIRGRCSARGGASVALYSS